MIHRGATAVNMATYGVGSWYAPRNLTTTFANRGIAAVGYNSEDAPEYHAFLNRVQVGGIAYIKSFRQNVGRIVKAVDIVTDATLKEDDNVGTFVRVRWFWTGDLLHWLQWKGWLN